MRLFNFAMAVTALSAVMPVANAFFSPIRIPKEMVPEKCRGTIEKAQEEGTNFDNWLRTNVCRPGHKVPFAQVRNLIDPVVERYLEFLWKRLSPPLDLKAEVLPFYKTIKRECIMGKQWGVVNHPDLCLAYAGDKKLSNMVNSCIIPKVVANYMFRSSEFSEWAKTNCEKWEPLIGEILVDTKCKTPHTFLSLHS